MSNPATATSINKRVFDNRVYSFAGRFPSLQDESKQVGLGKVLQSELDTGGVHPLTVSSQVGPGWVTGMILRNLCGSVGSRVRQIFRILF